jgi:ATP-dependent exoDNAse (exonuclease V) beta subunit
VSNLIPFPRLAVSPASLAPAPPDAHVRDAALDIHRSFVVEAPAGSGKTALLIQRYLKLLADESVTQPEQVLAITFTNLATAELRDRILEQLEAAQSERSQRRDAQVQGDAQVQIDMQSQILGQLAAAESESEPLHSNDAPSDFKARTRALAHAVLARDAELDWQLLDHPRRLNIRTIDSVCAEIAGALPVLSGSGGHLVPTDSARSLYREAARRTLLLLGGGDPAFDDDLRNILLHRDGNLADCETLLAEMLEWRDQWGDLIPLNRRELDDAWLDANVLPRLERALEHAIETTLERLDELFPSDVLSDLAHLAADLSRLPGYKGGINPLLCCAGALDSPDPVAPQLDRWVALIHLLLTKDDWRKRLAAGDLKFDFDRRHPHHPRLAAIVDQLRHRDPLADALLAAMLGVRELPPARYPTNQWAVAKSLFRILGRALIELQLVFAERAQCDFTELGLLARHALSSGSGAEDLASALGARLQHLLVDEMQDTSTGQYRLLELLTASWDGYSQTVFLVGDPHQSIYLFRQARVERFLQTLDSCSLGDLPLTRLALTANFRSQGALVGQFNHDFRLIFPAPPGSAQDPTALHYVDAHATLPASPSAEGMVWHAHPQPPQSRSATPRATLTPTQTRLDARSIARISGEWLARPLPPDRKTFRDEAGREVAEPWRIAVLVRGRTHLPEIVAELRRGNLPYRAVDVESLRDRQEVLDLTALTRTLLHPADRVAALAVLRAPWCGLPLAHLHTLTGGDDYLLRDRSILRLVEDRAHLLPADSQQRLSRTHGVLREAIANRARLTTAQLVERAWRSLGGDAPLTPAQLTNARRFFELLDSLESSAGRIDPTQLEDRLDQLYAEPDAIPAGSARVELMTIHKAKGLEWDLVLVPALERTPAISPSRLLTWSHLEGTYAGSAHIMLAPIAARGEDTDALTSWLKRRHKERERAEHKRLFYVACTRARQELHLFAAPRLDAKGGVTPAADALLKAAWPAAAPHFATAQPAASASSHADDDVEEALAIAAADSTDEDNDTEITIITNSLGEHTQVADERLLSPLFPPLTRLPLTFEPTSRFAEARLRTLSYGEPAASLDRTQFARPEGSFAARSFGNAVHTCIELLTARIASGASPATLLAELPGWSTRISALLRADGLSRSTVDHLTRDTRAALENLLRDPDALWLLTPHPGASSELALTAQTGSEFTSVRIDRSFRAGPEPHAPGDTHLWIVDYKTASHGSAKVADFLASQRAAYAPQLETYAAILSRTHSLSPDRVRLALCFPALAATPRLVWWNADRGEP